MPKPKKSREVEPEDEYTKLAFSELSSGLQTLKEKSEDLRQKRNYIQMDRDMVEQYFHNT